MPEPILVDVGWRNGAPRAALAFFPPEPIGAGEAEALARMFPVGGPANDLVHRIVQVRCAYDITIRPSPPGVRPVQYYRVPEEGGLSEAGFRAMVTPIIPSAQRNAATPARSICAGQSARRLARGSRFGPPDGRVRGRR